MSFVKAIIGGGVLIITVIGIYFVLSDENQTKINLAVDKIGSSKIIETFTEHADDKMVEEDQPLTDKTSSGNTANTSQKKSDEKNTPKTDRDGGQKADDFGRVGGMNHQYLQNGTFKRIIVEIDFAEGSSPSGTAVNKLISTINNITEKSEGIVLAGGNSFSATHDTYSVSQLLELAKENRSIYSSGDTAVIYIMYLNGRSSDSEGALGIAYSATSFAIFPDRIDDAITALVLAPSIESAVLIHEFGHLLGLVNINYTSDVAHEDTSYPKHSNNSESVMFWAVEDISVANVLRLGPPQTFDSADRSDIENIRQGIY